MTGYIFGLYVDDEEVDRTSLDEDSRDLAIELFMKEFGWNSKLEGKIWDVRLIKKEEEDD